MQVPTIHASAVLAGARAVLIRGPSGSGKSRLALRLLESTDRLRFTRLIGDDRIHIEPAHGRLLVRPAPALAGLLEVRGLGIIQAPYEKVACVGLVVDLAAPDAARMPGDVGRSAVIAGIRLARLAVAPEADPLPQVLAALHLPAGASPEAMAKSTG